MYIIMYKYSALKINRKSFPNNIKNPIATAQCRQSPIRNVSRRIVAVCISNLDSSTIAIADIYAIDRAVFIHHVIRASTDYIRTPFCKIFGVSPRCHHCIQLCLRHIGKDYLAHFNCVI